MNRLTFLTVGVALLAACPSRPGGGSRGDTLSLRVEGFVQAEGIT